VGPSVPFAVIVVEVTANAAKPMIEMITLGMARTNPSRSIEPTRCHHVASGTPNADIADP
jgi:hypothetical protein